MTSYNSPPPPPSPPPLYSDSLPPYTPSIHQQGTAGGKPVYVQGPPPLPHAPPVANVTYVNNPTSRTYQQHQVVVTQQQTQYVIPVCDEPYRRGLCPACRRGTLQDNFTVGGMILCIFLFPLGMICCLLMREKRCNVCGLRFP